MASVINTNMASLYAQKNLSGAQNALSTSVERLSSGLRINRAKDDAAGLGISEKIKSQVTSLNQGLRNANDAISMVQTAEGSLSEVSSILQRMKELSVQARNDSLSTTQRSFISDELVALKNEINAIAERTTFNDLSLLKNALRTQVAVPAAADATKLVNGASLLDGISVSNLAVKNTNAGTYTITTGTQTPIANQVSEASGAFGGQEVDTITIAGDFLDTGTADKIVATVAIEGGATFSATYTVTAADVAAGATTGDDNETRAAIAAGLAAELNRKSQETTGQALGITAVGDKVYIGSASASTGITVTTSVTTQKKVNPGTAAVGTSKINEAERFVNISQEDAVEGNKFVLKIGSKEYSVVAGFGADALTIRNTVATRFVTLLANDYGGTDAVTHVDNGGSTDNTGQIKFGANAGLGIADISLRVVTLKDDVAVQKQTSTVSNPSKVSSSVDRTITLADYDIVEGRRATVKIGNPDNLTTFSTIIGANDTKTTIATRLTTLINATHGSTTNSGAAITIASGAKLGMSNITLSFNETVDGDTVDLSSTVTAKNMAVADRTVTINQFDLSTGNIVSLNVGSKEYAVKVNSNDQAADIAARLSEQIDNDYPRTAGVIVKPTWATTTAGTASRDETNTITFNAITAGQTIIINGLTLTAVSNLTAAEVADAFDSQATAGPPANVAGKYTFTGTNNVTAGTGWTSAARSGASVTYTAVDTGGGASYDAVNLANTGTGTVASIVEESGGTVDQNEVQTATFGTAGMSAGDSITIAGLTFTASRDITQAEVASAFGSLAAGATSGSGYQYGYYRGALSGWSTTTATTTGVAFTATTVGNKNSLEEATTVVAVDRGVTTSSNVITFGSGSGLGLENISVSVKQITDPGKITITANADTGIGGTKQSIDVGTIAAGSAKTFDFDNLGVSFTLNNSRSTAVNSASFEAFTPKVNTLAVQSAMNGEALFQVGAGTRDNVVLDGFKDIRITGQNKNTGSEKEVFDKINETLTTIAANTTESLSEANFATLENRIEDAITMVSDFRSYFGGQQNRIEFAISNIQAQSENLTAANSRIVDTDYAAETANLTKTQIMQQAATAMLAQANQMPNVILALLK